MRKSRLVVVCIGMVAVALFGDGKEKRAEASDSGPPVSLCCDTSSAPSNAPSSNPKNLRCQPPFGIIHSEPCIPEGISDPLNDMWGSNATAYGKWYYGDSFAQFTFCSNARPGLGKIGDYCFIYDTGCYGKITACH